jgi:hypothetical protein
MVFPAWIKMARFLLLWGSVPPAKVALASAKGLG